MIFYDRGLQTTARGPNSTRKAISSGPQRHYVTNEKFCINEKFVIW